ncbi:DM13 domain-containing protein [Roseivirga misakiensis]|nr:DM13 domain-containing protein [Roseivirga misakiensis]
MKIISTFILLVSISFLNIQEVKYQGEWDNYSRWTTFEGSWKIIKSDNGHKLVLGDDFEAKKAPDLKIFLSKAKLDDIESKNALKIGEPVLVAKLTAYKGKATYDIPASIDVSKYQTIMVHCEEYSKFWGGSALK